MIYLCVCVKRKGEDYERFQIPPPHDLIETNLTGPNISQRLNNH